MATENAEMELGGQLVFFSHMPAGRTRNETDVETVLDMRHSAVIRRIAHFAPRPRGHFSGHSWAC